MKSMFNIFRNWRIVALTIIASLSMMLIAGECDDIIMFLFIKAVGFGLGFICYRLAKYWDERGLINELNQLSEGI